MGRVRLCDHVLCYNVFTKELIEADISFIPVQIIDCSCNCRLQSGLSILKITVPWTININYFISSDLDVSLTAKIFLI